MMRRTPMKRTGFSRKAPPSLTPAERPLRAMPTVDPTRFRLPQPVSGDVVAVAKTTYVRSKSLREAYRLAEAFIAAKDIYIRELPVANVEAGY